MSAPADGFLIRPLRVADADELGRVHVRVWREAYGGMMSAQTLADLDPAGYADMWQRAAERSVEAEPEYIVSDGARGSMTRVAEDAASGALVGFISVGAARDDDAPTASQLWAINVLAAQHGSGVAQRLVDAALGPDRPAYLWVVEQNARAQSFYRRNGFRTDGGRLRDDDLGCDEIRMVRR
ncbi:GNAT family N-acetyltransferase [Nakamurella aerolata]|uniref:GNAT family N-acetyltransferase n=1 Tax=Nakamurella aerolata TaxID=1656892 RepID=A0A849AEI2_9ACTN|nr:GNAT family N-acetyltransferase [Nakamurella aerolata]NNG36870.1 GNAT family N-acetyltransferase [Nakamurella aerolata]